MNTHYEQIEKAIIYIGPNPIAFLIPCHRVIQASGKIGGYHWGENIKHAIHAWEMADADEK